VDERFLTRLVRFDPGALVRMRPAAAGAQLWGALPWGVLAVVTVAEPVEADRTVSARDLLDGVARPTDRDSEWRFGLPPAAADPVEVLPVSVVRRMAQAAAETLRTALESGVDGRAVGTRRLRDALLDHIAVTVTVDRPDSQYFGRVVAIPQRMVQALTRMGWADDPAGYIDVLLAGPWVGLGTHSGAVWYRLSGPTLRPA
jgi:hypothetical protein